MTLGDKAGNSAVRLSVVDLRLRIEKLAIRAVFDSFPGAGVLVPQARISERLGFVAVAYGTSATRVELLGKVRLARHIYRRTSDVLHGRSNMVNLSVVLLAEWDACISDLESLAPTIDQDADAEVC